MSEISEHLYVADVDSALRFYTESLGFTYLSNVDETPENNPLPLSPLTVPVRGDVRLVIRGRTTIRLHESPPELVGDKQCSVPVDNVDAVFSEFQSRGVECESAPQVESVDGYNEQYIFRVRDPEGNVLLFYQRHDAT